MVGLRLLDMPLDLFGQIGLVMLIGLETKNAILIVEFGVEMRRTRGMSIIESAKAASRERLRARGSGPSRPTLPASTHGDGFHKQPGFPEAVAAGSLEN